MLCCRTCAETLCIHFSRQLSAMAGRTKQTTVGSCNILGFRHFSSSVPRDWLFSLLFPNATKARHSAHGVNFLDWALQVYMCVTQGSPVAKFSSYLSILSLQRNVHFKPLRLMYAVFLKGTERCHTKFLNTNTSKNYD